MRKVLIGIIMDGRAGGVDKHLLEFFKCVKNENCHFDFLTNKIDEELKQYLESNGAGLIEFPNLKRPFAQYKSVKALVKENGYDTVYMNISTALSFLPVVAAKKAGTQKVIVHSHSSSCDGAESLSNKIKTFLHKICKIPLCRYATHFCSCSDRASEWMFTEDVIKSGKITKVYNAVETKNFVFDEQKRNDMRKALGFEDSFVIGHIGNFLYVKNHSFIIDVLAELLKIEPKAKLLLLGDGELLESTKEKVESLGLSSSVIFAGRRQNANDYLQAMDVFVLPSIFEGLPIVSVEAQVNGLPVLLSDRISREAKIMSCCEFLSIDKPELWAQKAVEYKVYDRGFTEVVNKEYVYDRKNMREVYESIIGGNI